MSQTKQRITFYILVLRPAGCSVCNEAMFRQAIIMISHNYYCVLHGSSSEYDNLLVYITRSTASVLSIWHFYFPISGMPNPTVYEQEYVTETLLLRSACHPLEGVIRIVWLSAKCWWRVGFNEDPTLLMTRWKSNSAESPEVSSQKIDCELVQNDWTPFARASYFT